MILGTQYMGYDLPLHLVSVVPFVLTLQSFHHNNGAQTTRKLVIDMYIRGEKDIFCG